MSAQWMTWCSLRALLRLRWVEADPMDMNARGIIVATSSRGYYAGHRDDAPWCGYIFEVDAHSQAFVVELARLRELDAQEELALNAEHKLCLYEPEQGCTCANSMFCPVHY